jgi:hypothetical protein
VSVLRVNHPAVPTIVFGVWGIALRLNWSGKMQGKDEQSGPRRLTIMLWTILVVLGLLWFLGFSLHVGGSLIHLLIVVALVVFVINLVGGRRRSA